MKRIPRIFHFVFGLRPQNEAFHLMHYLCIASCIGVNRPDEVMFHYHHMPWGPWWDLIKPKLRLQKIEPDEFVSSFSYPDNNIDQFRYAHLADIARLEILIRYGGVYADIDTLFVNKIPDFLFEQKFVMGIEKTDWNASAAAEAGGSLCNALIMGEPDSDFARLWLKKTYECFDGSWSRHCTFLPFLMSREYPGWIHVEPERSFFYYDWTSKGIADIFEKPQPGLDGVYSIHLWSHIWWDGKGSEIPYIYEGRLTPEYIRFSRSAYAELARPFLPEGVTVSRRRYILQASAAFLKKALYFIKRQIRRLVCK